LTLGDISQEDWEPRPQTDILRVLGKLTGFVEPEAQMPGFSLNLRDGSRWWITGSRFTMFIAEKLAFIMQLQQGHFGEGNPQDDRLMYFYEKNVDHRRLEPLFSPDQGWTNLNHRFALIRYHAKLHHIVYEYDSTGENSSSSFLPIWRVVPSVHWESICRGGLPFHAALLERHGQGVVLAAPGDTGKSTCSHRVVYPWQARCDDEVLVVLTPGGRYLAHPFPTWTDYLYERAENTWKVEDAIPLAGIFFLEQSPQDECVPLEGAQAAAEATSSAEQTMTRFLRWFDIGEARKVRWSMFANACEIVKQVPTFHLRVSLHGNFWEKIEAALAWH